MPKNEYPQWAIDLGAAVQDANKARELLFNAVHETAMLEDRIRAALIKLSGDRVTTSRELQKLLDQLHAIGGKRNQMDMGGFLIGLQHALDDAWRKIP
jgi:hypothetical protein